MNWGCDESLRGKPMSSGIAYNFNSGLDRLIVYMLWIDPALIAHIDAMIPGITPCENLIADAIDAWLVVIDDLSIKFHDHRDDCNIVVELATIDNRGGILAEATVGGPHSLDQSWLKVDRAETFDEKKFLSVLTHEFGHVFGLTHIQQQCLMNPTYDPAIIEPVAIDLGRMRDLWS